MYKVVPCSIEGCHRPSFSLETLCFDHLKNDDERMRKSLEELRSQTLIMNRVFDDATIMGMDFSRYRFVGCSFRNVKMHHVMLTGASLHLSFLDGSEFISCDFSGTDIDFCSFGSSNFIDCSLENSELIHTNFNGSRFSDCTFSGSNLYNSRFLLCDLDTVSFDNCDFKRAFYIPAKESGVTFARSNIAEAVRDLEHLYL